MSASERASAHPSESIDAEAPADRSPAAIADGPCGKWSAVPMHCRLVEFAVVVAIALGSLHPASLALEYFEYFGLASGSLGSIVAAAVAAGAVVVAAVVIPVSPLDFEYYAFFAG